MGWIVIALPHDRSQPGILRVLEEDGREVLRVPCLGKADNLGAANHGNPSRDPRKPFGDLPTGSYAIRGLSPVDATDPEEINRYGPHGKFVLEPLSGDAFAGKENGRYGLLIHGGLPAAGQKLRPTYGCARLFDADMAQLVALHQQDPLRRCIVEEEGT